MTRPPSAPHGYRILYRDGRAESIAARGHLQVRDMFVFYSEKRVEVLRVPVADVLEISPEGAGPGKAGRRRV